MYLVSALGSEERLSLVVDDQALATNPVKDLRPLKS